ncbi:urea ABC transporter, permease protein UrtB [Haloplanus aerogenes]|uniref:Branched-chain amino acid transport system permease protein n=1 Tax=Haloplanus aerogenes TaxID=660522 RepID=A0A3M0EAE3_9EURY|nr:urea ABC transporter, permease protein UrtB [Haloplanus aerogenes]AZH25411.1 urea ABC transporter, permease protein UrtB [Haloplanus aerogenes]RMB25120.1 branched-chain amino acid transport system permease protein [Haloplanus aerogenes]
MASVLPQLLNLLLQFIDSFGFLVLSAIGLAIIFGMMGVINLAHGEFITVGAYGTALSFHAGLPLPVAMLVGVALTTVFGLILEFTVIRRLYGRLLDSMVATWGISLIMIQGLRIVFGSSLPSIGTPLGSVQYGSFSYSTYRLLLAGASLVLLGVLYWVFTSTEFGTRARATIQDEEMSRALGTDTNRMYLLTFGIGSALAGLTGALYAPTMTIVPGMGSTFLVEAFVTVVVGGASVLVGTSGAGLLLGFINAVFSNLFGTFAGRMALLVTTILVIRALPRGITGLLEDVRGGT